MNTKQRTLGFIPSRGLTWSVSILKRSEQSGRGGQGAGKSGGAQVGEMRSLL